MRNKITQPHKGFTLIELLVTIAIIMILAALSTISFKFVTGKQKIKQAEIQVQLLSAAIQEYKRDYGVFPDSNASNGSNPLYVALYHNGEENPTTDTIYLADLDPDVDKQKWVEGSGSTATIVDPWGNEYKYSSPGQVNPDFDITSGGSDGTISTTEDNITNY